MLRPKYCAALVFCVFFLSGASNPGLVADNCEIGLKLGLFDKMRIDSNNAVDEKLLLSLLSEPLFIRDDEKYVLALRHLLRFPGSKTQAVEKIRKFLDRSKNVPSANILRERRASACGGCGNRQAHRVPFRRNGCGNPLDYYPYRERCERAPC